MISAAILKGPIDDALAFLDRELASVRTGRANSALIEDIAVSCYGATTPLVQLASIGAPEPQTLVVQPWDPSIIKDIDRAISQSGLGITPVVDGKVIRLPFPPMTEERRKELVKVVNEKSEQVKVRVRGLREDVMKKMRLEEKEGAMSEDVVATTTKEVQKLVDAANADIEKRAESKRQELLVI